MATKVRQQVNKGIIAPYVDAKKNICITVTKLDTKHAKCFAPDECVLAKATARSLSLPGMAVEKAWFYKGAAYIAYADPVTAKPIKTVRYIPSKNAAKSIDSFDHGKGFKPGKYWLEAPKGSNTIEAITKRGKKRLGERHRPTGKGAPRRPRKVVQPQKKTRLQYAYPY